MKRPLSQANRHVVTTPNMTTIRFTVPATDKSGREFDKLVAYSYPAVEGKDGGFWCHKNFEA